MSRNICVKTVLKTISVSILAVLFYTACDDNGVKVVTPEVTTFVDGRDGKTYKKVKIGGQIWMAENLNYEADGSKCGESWDRTPEQNCEEFGRLYDWNTAMDYVPSSESAPSGVEGVCPVGWHIPSDAEWQTLIDYVEPNAGTKLKSRTHTDTHAPGGTPAPTGTDKYRFSALKGPYASQWWSSTESEKNSDAALVRIIYQNNRSVLKGDMDKREYFLSVRCVHD